MLPSFTSFRSFVLFAILHLTCLLFCSGCGVGEYNERLDSAIIRLESGESAISKDGASEDDASEDGDSEDGDSEDEADRERDDDRKADDSDDENQDESDDEDTPFEEE